MVAETLGAVGSALAEETKTELNCKPRVSAEGGTRPTEGWARRSADSEWSKLAGATYGMEFSDLSSAKDLNYHCPVQSAGKKCTVTATPCRAQ
jgi:hypothetical protein